jgi:hypothetical protein
MSYMMTQKLPKAECAAWCNHDTFVHLFGLNFFVLPDCYFILFLRDNLV